MKYFVKVAILNHHLKPLIYYSNSSVIIGERVWVYVKNQKKLGMVVAILSKEPAIKNLKPVTSIDGVPCLPITHIKLAEWMSAYYMSPISEVLGIMLPNEGFAKANLNDKTACQTITVTDLGKTTTNASHAQKALIEWLIAKQNLLITWGSCQDAGFKSSTIKACIERKWLAISKNKQQLQPVDLRAEQQVAVNQIQKNSGFAVFVLAGVTGSGKTEVYCKVISDVIASGKQALVLVPEIGLTQQTVSRFVARCGVPALVIHSKITAQQKIARWQAVFSNNCSLVIGTRSSLFAPMNNLGVIVIDESHDQSFKQQNTCLYSAKHTAIMLAKLIDIPIVLGSATPSLESLHRCNQQVFHYLELKEKAFATTKPDFTILNMCGQKHTSGISIIVKQTIEQVIKKQQQVLIFVNRRGYAPVMLCHTCGEGIQCHSCDSNFVLHQAPKHLRCHHCSKTAQLPERCSNCGAKSWLTPGLGTQKVTEQLATWFPKANIIRVDRDNTKSQQEFNQALFDIDSGAVDIIVGTQMLAKGHDFKNIGLVVVLDCDAQLYNPDYMAVERLAQLLVQVAGRAGRRADDSKILIQSHQPQHPVFKVINDGYFAWAKQEMHTRQKYNLAPFSFHLNIHIQAQKAISLDKIRQEFSNVARYSGVVLVGPIANLQPKRKGFWRDVVMLTAGKRELLLHQVKIIQAAAEYMGWNKLAQFRYDIDPIEMS